MADTHTIQQRSFNMSRIKAKDTKPEMLVCEFLQLKKNKNFTLNKSGS